ncbi:LytR/AlgR family response regulator transcription factor [Lacrimispora indolis]|uniref:LytR/AlgR family response regulator transcription factor n=1 Tax=Lacrimispora indolis TaxID=69825 RepID=UPI00045EA2DF|nr:LytTR family DNA-binding domain-containing protein [Lacrimispora indolis]
MIIAICDDNEQELKQCKKRLELLASIHQIDAEFSLYHKGEELLFHLQSFKNYPDIIYLDMRMNGIQGDEVARKLRDQGCISEIVFFTVSKDYYTTAFDVRALHYVVKGETTVEKFEDIFMQAVKSVQEKQTEYIMCTGAGEFRKIEIKKIHYFEVVKRIVTVYYGSDQFSFYSTIGKIELRLKDYGFVRVHKSYVAAIAHIRTFSFKEIILDTGTVLPVGRSYYSELKREMEEYAESGAVV